MLVSVVGLLRSLSNASPRTTLRCSSGVQGIVIGFWATELGFGLLLQGFRLKPCMTLRAEGLGFRVQGTFRNTTAK